MESARAFSRFGNLSVIGLLDFHLEVVDFSRVDELPGVKVGDSFQGGLGLFRVDALELLELGGQGVDFFAPRGGFPVDGGNFVHEVGDVIRNLRTVFGNPYWEAVLHRHMAVFVELELHDILLGSGWASHRGIPWHHAMIGGQARIIGHEYRPAAGMCRKGVLECFLLGEGKGVSLDMMSKNNIIKI